MIDDPFLADYIFLDDEPDRKRFLASMHDVRQAVRNAINHIPENQWYEPRYHGWSPAAMLSHLNTMDNLGMLAIKGSLVGIRPSVGEPFMHQIEHFTARVFRKRLVAASFRSMDRNEKRIGQFIMQLPVSNFSKPVYSPIQHMYVTLERAVQVFFLFHWRGHLQTIHEVEGIQRSSDNG